APRVAISCAFPKWQLAERVAYHGAPMPDWLAVLVGGGAGALARYAVGHWASARFPHTLLDFPWHTFGINVAGSFVLGLVAGWCGGRERTTLLPLSGFARRGYTSLPAARPGPRAYVCAAVARRPRLRRPVGRPRGPLAAGAAGRAGRAARGGDVQARREGPGA